jgi:hypothetical protein
MTKDALSKIKVLAESLVPADAKKASEPKTEDAAQPSWVNQVAVLTGVLAALAGFLTVRATTLTNDAIYESNQAVLAQTEASDAWGEYQADSIKARIVETQLLPSVALSAEDKTKLAAEDKDLRDRQPKSKQDAQDKLKDRQDHLARSRKRLDQKDLLGYAGMAAQLGIALASVAALTRRREVFYLGIIAGLASVVLTAWTLIGDYLQR